MDARSTATTELTAVELRDRIAQGALKAREAAEAFLQRVRERDGEIGAFAWHDPDFVRHQADALDRHRESGRPLGALHGVPVALKDIIDTARIPTANGTAMDAGRTPGRDAAIVERLKAEGAIILGKTVTTELAGMEPAGTRNPHNTAHTPGGSSSGSAAAVAAGMAPLAIGTQTRGSVIRPAAFCGVTGFKPTFGAIPRTGVLRQSQTLDTVGVFARTVEDAAMLAEALFGADEHDPATAPAPHPRLLETARSKPPVKPMFALVHTPFRDRADAQTGAALAELAAFLGENCFEAELPEVFAGAPAIVETINLAEMSKNCARYLDRGRDTLGERTVAALEKGSAITARDYLAALDWREVLYAGLAEIFERCDAIITPAAPGPAPRGLESTGDPVFNELWTLCGTPAITIPAFEAENGLPMGVQLIGPRGHDGRLLRTARWLADTLAAGSTEEERYG
ncbi:amidase [Oricola thermophila]|uniref:Amidase n=1 Tax=Oricola thermophila TaxID=2742145 RepID=A0A6N1VJ30_9HYPH|nr:amidase [Oricola thermophila]QKV19392.1 amidase [Oricola thermophila]